MTHLGQLFDLTGKTAIVTGASYGLGVTLARALAGAGANVALAARSVDKLQAVSQSIGAEGGTALSLPCDVSVPAQVQSIVATTVEQFGRVDILVNNAGIAPEAGMMPERVPDDVFEHTLRTNLLGTWYCCRAVGSSMLGDGKGGSIINIASIGGLSGLTDFLPGYSATKAGILSLTRTLACSWGDRAVRVNAIAPGWFPSEMTGPFLGIPAFRTWAENLAPLRRIGDPKELVGALLFLASEASSYVTGHTLVVDGGYTASMGSSPYPLEVYQLLADTLPADVGKHIRPA